MLTILERSTQNLVMERSTQKQVDVPDGWLSVDVYGEADGPAIVVIPGVMADAQGWAAVAQHLTGWQTVAVVNRRGRHPSGPLTREYGLHTEVRDAEAVLREFGDVRTVFGWSYGGLIALHLANKVAVPQVIAYEPIMALRGSGLAGSQECPHRRRSRPQCRSRARAGRRHSRRSHRIAESDHALWAGLRDVSAPIYRETQSINDAPVPDEFAEKAGRIDSSSVSTTVGRRPTERRSRTSAVALREGSCTSWPGRLTWPIWKLPSGSRSWSVNYASQRRNTNQPRRSWLPPMRMRSARRHQDGNAGHGDAP